MTKQSMLIIACSAVMLTAGCGNRNDGSISDVQSDKRKGATQSKEVKKEISFAAETTFKWSTSDIVDGDDIKQEAALVRVTGVASPNVEIPDKVGEAPVVAIAEEAFADVSSLVESIRLPNTVRYIGKRSFAGCAKLKSVSIGTGVKTIADEAFAGCVALKTIDIPKGVERLCGSLFKDCSALESLRIPESCIIKGNEFGSGLNALKKLSFSCKSMDGDSGVKISNFPALEEIEIDGKGYSYNKSETGNSIYKASLKLELESVPNLAQITLPQVMGEIKEIKGMDKCPKLIRYADWKSGDGLGGIFGIKPAGDSASGYIELLEHFRALNVQIPFEEVKSTSAKIKALNSVFSNEVARTKADVLAFMDKYSLANMQVEDILLTQFCPYEGRYNSYTFKRLLSVPDFSVYSRLDQNGRYFQIGNLLQLFTARAALRELQSAVASQLAYWEDNKNDGRFRFCEGLGKTENCIVYDDLAIGMSRNWLKCWVLSKGAAINYKNGSSYEQIISGLTGIVSKVEIRYEEAPRTQISWGPSRIPAGDRIINICLHVDASKYSNNAEAWRALVSKMAAYEWIARDKELYHPVGHGRIDDVQTKNGFKVDISAVPKNMAADQKEQYRAIKGIRDAELDRIKRAAMPTTDESASKQEQSVQIQQSAQNMGVESNEQPKNNVENRPQNPAVLNHAEIKSRPNVDNDATADSEDQDGLFGILKSQKVKKDKGDKKSNKSKIFKFKF